MRRGSAGFTGAGAGTPCCAGGVGAGFGRLCLSQASHSISSEKLKMKSRMSRCVSIFMVRGRSRRDAMAPQRHKRRAASQPPRNGAMARQRLVGIVGAARMEAAGRRQDRPQAPLIGAHRCAQRASHHAALKVLRIARSRSIICAEALTP